MSLFLSLLVLVIAITIGRVHSTPNYCVSKLPSLIDTQLQKLPRTRQGLLIKAFDESGTETVLYERNSQEFLTPASNNKVLTTSAAFLDLGKDFRFKTPLTQGRDRKLCLTMTGSPELSIEDLNALIGTAKAHGAKSFTLDTETFFGKQSEGIPGVWEFGDLPFYYAAQPVSASIARRSNTRGVCNTFVLEISPGSSEGEPMNVSVVEPSGISQEFWKRAFPVHFESTTAAEGSGESRVYAVPALGFEGATIKGALSVGDKSHQLTITHTNPVDFAQMLVSYLASLQQVGVELGQCYDDTSSVLSSADTEPLSVLMDHTLKESDNTYTELFLRNLGARYLNRNDSSATAEATGISTVSKILTQQLSVPEGSFKQFDGSGLSRWDLVSPESLVQTITVMNQLHPEYIDFFPEAGRSGTLARRFLDHPGILRAKTGTLTGVTSLSGVIYAKKFSHIVFSMLINQSTSRASSIREVLDTICVMAAFADPTC